MRALLCCLALLVVSATHVVAQQRDRHLYVLNSDGTGLRQLVAETDYNRQGSPEWSPDGKRIAFDAWRRSPTGERISNTKMFIVNVDGSDLKEIGDGSMPSFSADGHRVGFCRGGPRRGIWTMDINGADEQLVDQAGWAARWSPDGQKIAYTVRDLNGANIVVYDIATKRKTRVLNGEHSARYTQIRWSFGWSPDNRRLCFCGDLGPEMSEATIASVDGSDKHFQVLLVGQFAAKLSWHPDGTRTSLCHDRPDAEDRAAIYGGSRQRCQGAARCRSTEKPVKFHWNLVARRKADCFCQSTKTRLSIGGAVR